MSYLDIFKQIRSLESVFPLPINYATIDVGTFDAATGQFAGLTTESETDPEPIEHGPKQRPTNPPPHFSGSSWVSSTIDSRWIRTITTTPAPKVGFQPVLLAFKIKNQGANSWTVSAGDSSQTVPASQSSVSINIWDLASTAWSIQSGGQSYADRIMIQRPAQKIVGVGAFSLPALPLSIVYAPPADSSKLSKASYQVSQSVGVKSSFQLSTDSSTTKDWYHSPDLKNLKGFQDVLGGLGKVFSLSKDPTFAAMSKALDGIVSGIGTITGSETNGTIDVSNNTLSITESRAQSIVAESRNGGPGAGDSIHYIRDAKFAWVVADGRLQITLLGGIYTSFPASYLSANINDPSKTGLPADVAKQLLSLDPFVAAGNMASLSPVRFEDVDAQIPGPLEYGGGQTLAGSYSQTFETSQSTTHTTYTTQTDDFNPGWLSKLFGAERAGLKISMSSTQSAGTTTSQTQTISWELHSGPSDRFVVEIWRDSLFGTYAFRQEPVNATARLQGIAKGNDGAPLQNQPITLAVNGRTYSTITDKNGHYAFFARAIPAGTASLRIGRQPPKNVMIPAH